MGWYPATVKTAATAEPVTVAAARRQCGIAASDSSQDDQLTLLIAGARRRIEKHCCIMLPKQTITVPCDDFADFVRLPQAPVLAVVGISYIDQAGASQTLPQEAYEPRLDGLRPSIARTYRTFWPVVRPGSRIVVELEVGYTVVPEDIQQALLLMVRANFVYARPDLLKRSETVEGVGATQWYAGIEISQALQVGIDSLLSDYRCWPLA